MKYLENRLSSKDLYFLKIHLNNCESCNKEFSFYENMNMLEEMSKTSTEELSSINVMDPIRDCSYSKIVPKDFSIKAYLLFLSITSFLGTIFIFIAIKENLKYYFVENGIMDGYYLLYNIDTIFFHIKYIFLNLIQTLMDNMYILRIFCLIFLLYAGAVCLFKKKYLKDKY